MKKQLSLLTAAAVIGCASQASAQGLLNIGRLDDFDRSVPLAVTVGLSAGYDSNPNSSSFQEEGSTYFGANVGVDYNTGDRRTAYNFGLVYSPLYYVDAPPNQNDYIHNVRGSFNWRHQYSPRLTLSNSAYLAYEVEPNFGIGASVARRNQNYFYGYESLAATYMWTRRLSTVTSYTLFGISYESDDLKGEDMISHTFANEFRYAWSRVDTLALTYRLQLAQYDNGIGDFTSNYLLVGLDHKFAPRTTGSFRVGAEFRDRDNFGSDTMPYFEGSLAHSVSRRTAVRWYTRIGMESTDIGGFGDRYSYRTGLTANHQFTSRLSANTGLHYIHDIYEGSSVDASNFDEDVFAFSLGANYNIYRNVTLNAGYSLTVSNSGNEFRDFDRHMFTAGIGARF
jgi:opacity protein-like surface antigen